MYQCVYRFILNCFMHYCPNKMGGKGEQCVSFHPSVMLDDALVVWLAKQLLLEGDLGHTGMPSKHTKALVIIHKKKPVKDLFDSFSLWFNFFKQRFL